MVAFLSAVVIVAEVVVWAPNVVVVFVEVIGEICNSRRVGVVKYCRWLRSPLLLG